MFSPLSLGEVRVRNRVVISPMQEYAAQTDGVATDFHLVHLGRFAMGGAGLVFTEALAVEPEGRLTYSDLGIWDDAQVGPLKRIAQFLREQGAAAGAQLLHAGRKASVQRPWHGYLPLGEADVSARGERPWETIGPTALPALPDWPVPREMTVGDIMRVVEAHAEGARRCREAGFDVLNVHGAHGYLIHSFLSPLSNHREDGYGGDRAGRMRLALEIAEAVRGEWPASRPLFFRLSCVDDLDDGWTLDDTLVLSAALAGRGVDVIDCSSRGLARRGTPVVVPREPGFQVPYARAVKREVPVMTCAVGLLMDFDHANQVIANGDADLVAIGREALRNPNWAGQASVALRGGSAYESDWPPRWGWWLVRREQSLKALRGANTGPYSEN